MSIQGLSFVKIVCQLICLLANIYKHQLKAKLPMSTPLKLKRDAPSMYSTFDRTVAFTQKMQPQSQKTVIPSRSISNIFNLQNLMTHHNLKTSQPLTSVNAPLQQFINTEELERKVEQIIEQDELKSQRSRDGLNNHNDYRERHIKMKLSKGGPWRIPTKISEYVDSLGKCQIDHPNFKKGCLSKAGICFFAIENKVFFYDIGRAIVNGLQLEDCFMNSIEFEAVVYDLKQIEFENQLFREFKSKNKILITHPWQLSFAILQVEDNNQLANSKNSRWFRITNLNYKFEINCQCPQKLVQSRKEIYYLDQKGCVNKGNITKNDWFGCLVSGSRLKLACKSKSQSLSANHFYISRKVTFQQKIKHYMKVISAKASKFYNDFAINYDLIYDNKRRLLYSLVETIPSKEGQRLSFSKILTCWDARGDQLVQKCKISELQLYQLQVQSIANSHVSSNYSISKIFAVQESFYPQSNLMILLKNGIRLFMKVGTNFQLVYHLFPPNLQPDQKYNKRSALEADRPVEMTMSEIKGSSFLFNVQSQKQNHTFFIWKMHEQQGQNMVQILWRNNMSEGEGQIPLQSSLHMMAIGSQNTKKNQILQRLRRKSCKSSFSSSSSAPFLHEIAKGLYNTPQFFLHLTDTVIEYLCILRPIDILVNVLITGITDQNIICRILTDIDVADLQFMLIQLLCDREGIYFKNQSIISCISAYHKKLIETGGKRQFQNFLAQYQRKIDESYYPKSARPNQLPSVIVGRQQIIEMDMKIKNLIFQLSKRPINISTVKSEQQICASNCNAILTYLSRLLMFLWTKEISEINNKILHLIDFLNPITEIIEYLQAPKGGWKYSLSQNTQVKLERVFVDKQLEKKSITLPKQTEINGYKLLKHFINKITQLIILCSKVKLNINKSFNIALSLDAEFYEQHLFNFMIENYQKPAIQIDIYREIFPIFISKELEKTLKIYSQTKNKDIPQILQILKYHKKLPQYLINYLKIQNNIKDCQLR